MATLLISRAVRRRLTWFVFAAPVFALAAALALYGLRGSISYFYTPSQALAAHVAPGRAIELGGLVQNGSVTHREDGGVEFTVLDHSQSSKIIYHGALPDLFREGQGVVASGAYNDSGIFIANQILAKHDERYMPRELARALKARGEWRPGA